MSRTPASSVELRFLTIRSRQKEMRRQAILDAAEGLIRDIHSTSFSMLMLAERSGLSPATPYNIFGSKASILYALLNRSLDGISMKFGQFGSVGDPYETVLTAARAAAWFFVADPSYYRPLYQHLIGVNDPVHRPAFMQRSFVYWRAALARLREDGKVASDHAQGVLARSIMTYFLGSLDFWVQRELDDEQFSSHVLHGVASLLLSVATSDSQPLLAQTMASASQGMPSAMQFHPESHGTTILT